MTTEPTTPSTWTCECGRANADLPDVRFCAGCGKKRRKPREERVEQALAIVGRFVCGEWEDWATEDQEDALAAVDKASKALGVDKLKARIGELEAAQSKPCPCATMDAARDAIQRGADVSEAAAARMKAEARREAFQKILRFLQPRVDDAETEHARTALFAVYESIEDMLDASQPAPAEAKCPKCEHSLHGPGACDGHGPTCCCGMICACDAKPQSDKCDHCGGSGNDEDHPDEACSWCGGRGDAYQPWHPPKPAPAVPAAIPDGTYIDGYCSQRVAREGLPDYSKPLSSAQQPGEVTMETLVAKLHEHNGDDSAFSGCDAEIIEASRADIRANVARATAELRTKLDEAQKQSSYLRGELIEIKEIGRGTIAEKTVTDCAQLVATIGLLRHDKEAYATANVAGIAEIRRLEADAAELRKQAEADKATIAELRKLLDGTRVERDRQMGEKVKARDERDAARAELAEVGPQVTALAETICNLGRPALAGETTLASATRMLREMKARLDEFEEAAAEAQGIDEENHYLQLRVRELEDKHGRDVVEYEHMMAERNATTDELKVASAELARVRSRNDTLRKALREQRMRLVRKLGGQGEDAPWIWVANKVDERNTELAEAKRERADYGNRTTETIGKLEAELALVKSNNEELVRKLLSTQVELEQAELSAVNWEKSYDKVCMERDEVKAKLGRRTQLLLRWLEYRSVPRTDLPDDTEAELATDQPAETGKSGT